MMDNISHTTTPISEDDLGNLDGLNFAIEVCADAIIGLVDEQTARKALPTLVELQRAEIDRLGVMLEARAKGGAA